jgi:hypothetical protein
LDVEIEQNDLDVFFIFTFTDGTTLKRRAKLPKPLKGDKGKEGAFWVRGGIANTNNNTGTQQVYVLADILDPAPVYAGVPLLVFRPTGAPDTYTMEIIAS